jgi:hypothetical protein
MAVDIDCAPYMDAVPHADKDDVRGADAVGVQDVDVDVEDFAHTGAIQDGDVLPGEERLWPKLVVNSSHSAGQRAIMGHLMQLRDGHLENMVFPGHKELDLFAVFPEP